MRRVSGRILQRCKHPAGDWRFQVIVIATRLALCLTILAPCEAEPQPGRGANPSTSPSPTESYRRLTAEFDAAQQAAFDAVRRTRTEGERTALSLTAPDPRKYARRFLELARGTDSETVAVDCLIWVVRHVSRTPEGQEAIRRIAQQHIR